MQFSQMPQSQLNFIRNDFIGISLYLTEALPGEFAFDATAVWQIL